MVEAQKMKAGYYNNGDDFHYTFQVLVIVMIISKVI